MTPEDSMDYCLDQLGSVQFRCKRKAIDNSPESFQSLFRVSGTRIKSGDTFLIRMTFGRSGGLIVNLRSKVGESKGNCLVDIPGDARESGRKLHGARPWLNGTRSVSSIKPA